MDLAVKKRQARHSFLKELLQSDCDEQQAET
jgi:hypothetical protein